MTLFLQILEVGLVVEFVKKNSVFHKNLTCNKCEYPFKTLWRCKYGHHKEWVSICYNCIKEIRFVNVRFISQTEIFKRMKRCRLKLSNLELPILYKLKYEVI